MLTHRVWRLPRKQRAAQQFVVSGKAAEQIQDFTTISLATAQRIADACEKAAVAENVGISVMVLDKDGNHVYMDRMDGQGYLNIVTADMKARTALTSREPSKKRMNGVTRDPAQEFEDIQLGYFSNSGGLPIVVNKQLIGAVGVGGSAPRVPVWSDEICARKALVEVIGPSVAPLIEDIPPRRNPNPGTAPVPRFTAAAPPKSSLAPEFVVGGKGAGTVFDGNQISLAAAQKVARTCRDWAAAKGASMSLYIIDNAGEFVHVERMDGQVSEDMRTALLKERRPTLKGITRAYFDPRGAVEEQSCRLAPICGILRALHSFRRTPHRCGRADDRSGWRQRCRRRWERKLRHRRTQSDLRRSRHAAGLSCTLIRS